MDGQGLDGSAELNDAENPAEESAPDEENEDRSKIYWAKWKGSDLRQALDDKQQAYFETARNRGLVSLWVIAYAAHHGTTPEDLRELSTQQIGFVGAEAETLRFNLNLARGYTRRQSIMALGERPAFKAMTINSDHKSQATAELSDSIVNALYTRYAAKCDPKVAESDGFVGEGGTHYRWDFQGGDMVSQQQEMPLPLGGTQTVTTKVRSGAPTVTVMYPWSKFHETRNSGELLWMCVKETESKWNLIAQYPALEEEILKVPTTLDIYDFGQLFRLEELEFANKDLMVVRHFYHARCPAMPEGRYVVMVGDVILWDGPCPTKEGLPIAWMKAADWIETNFGYCDGWDLLSISQALNQVNSDEMGNYSQFGRQSVAYEKGTNVTAQGLMKGTDYEFPPGAKPPTAIQLTAIPATLPDLKQYLHRMLDLMSDQSATNRGDPDANVRSGEMAALLDSIALRYQSYRQNAVREFRIRGAQIILDMINRYGETPFLVEIAGATNRAYVQEFTKDDLSGIERVTMDVVSPIMQTIAGRLQMFMQITAAKLPPEREAAAYELIVNGDASIYSTKDRALRQYIQRENEDLVTGLRPVAVAQSDNPFMHWPEHIAQRNRIMASDNQDAEALKRLDDHCNEHTQVYLAMSPLTCGFLGIPTPPAIPPNPQNEFGNPAWQFQMLTAAGMPAPPTEEGGGGAGAAGGGGNPQADQGAQAQVNDQQGNAQVHPSGTPLPQPSTPPGQ